MLKLHEPVHKEVAAIEKLMGFKNDPQYNHGQLLHEATRTASWVLDEKTPVSYIDTTFQVGEFYGLQVVRQYKGKYDFFIFSFEIFN